MSRFLGLALFMAVAGAAPAAQSIPRSVIVRVVDADTGKPLRGVRVGGSVRTEANLIIGVEYVTGPSGLVLIPVPATGPLGFTVTCPAWFIEGVERGFIRIPKDADGSYPLVSTVRMTRGGVITGRIVDEFGEPLVDVPVTMNALGSSGRVGWIQGARSQTDDRGEYRFAGLRPGPYVVGVKPRYAPRVYDTVPEALISPSTWTNVLQGWAAEDDPAVATMSPMPAPEAGHAPTGYLTTFYPGVDEGEAQAVVVEAGRERSGVNFRMRTVPMGLLRGSVTGAGNIKELKVTMVPNRGSTGPIGATSSGIDGHFVMPFVPLGAYTLTATAIASQGGDRYSAVLTVVVDGQSHTAPLSITLERAR